MSLLLIPKYIIIIIYNVNLIVNEPLQLPYMMVYRLVLDDIRVPAYFFETTP